MTDPNPDALLGNRIVILAHMIHVIEDFFRVRIFVTQGAASDDVVDSVAKVAMGNPMLIKEVRAHPPPGYETSRAVCSAVGAYIYYQP